jgi:hypothetical protein
VDDVEGLWFSPDIYNNCPRCEGSGLEKRTDDIEER